MPPSSRAQRARAPHARDRPAATSRASRAFRGLTLSLSLAAALAVAARARASASAERDSVALSIGDCPGLSAEVIRELVALELAPRRVVLQASEADAASRTNAQLACHEERVRMTVREPGRAESLALELDLSATPPPARPRLVALTLSELVVTSRMEARARAEADARALAAAPEVGDAPRPRAFELWVGAGLLRGGEPAAFVAALSAGALWDLGGFGVLADVQGEWGDHELGAGEARMWALSLSAAPAVVWSGEALELFAGVGLRAGYARLGGRSTEPALAGRELDGTWVAPLLAAGAHLRVMPALALRAALDLGYVAKPLRGLDAAGRDFYALDGVRLALLLGVALRL